MNLKTALPWRRYKSLRFRVMDLAFLSYTALTGVFIALFPGHFRRSPAYALIHLAIVLFGLEVIRAGEARPDRGWLWGLRVLYSLPLMLFLWTEMDAIVPVLFGSYWATDLVIAADKALFGVHPSVWVHRFHGPLLNEVMTFFYTAYFLFIIGIPLSFFIRRKYEKTIAVLSLINLTYYSNYLLFLLLPALSPSHSPALAGLHTPPGSGYLFFHLNRALQSSGGVHGAAFPSSHVAGALVWVLAAARYGGKKAYLLLVVVLGVSLATVYMGYHHALDPIVGALWGGLCYAAALAWMKRRGEDPRP
ncbi:MAG: phosphatase PAP2 family protein [Candidatus Aminicenantes bacterium]|nr:phosphatase PAP2 family protein [Candidatus Aminicenantes bacterium]